MAAFQNIGIDGYFKRYGFKYGIKRALFMINDIHIVKDYENKKILYYHKAQKYLFRKYAKYANVDPYGIVFGDQELDNPIWIYWKQGINNAPILVQKCVESVQNNTSGHVIVLDDESVKQYVTLPDDILKKYFENEAPVVFSIDEGNGKMLELMDGCEVSDITFHREDYSN